MRLGRGEVDYPIGGARVADVAHGPRDERRQDRGHEDVGDPRQEPPEAQHHEQGERRHAELRGEGGHLAEAVELQRRDAARGRVQEVAEADHAPCRRPACALPS